MRTLLLAILFGLTGIGFGYWRFNESNKQIVESFRDPIEVMQGQLGNVSVQTVVASRARIEVVGGTEHDFGLMQSGTKRSHNFVLRNNGNAPSKITLGPTTCKCTLGELDKSVLNPGEETSVSLSWTAAQMLSQFAQTATVMTDDPDHLEIKLIVKGSVSNALAFEPFEVAVGDISSSDRIRRSVRILSCYEDPLEIKEIRWGIPSSESKVKFSHKVRALKEGEEPNNADARYVAEIDVDIDPGLPLGPLNGFLIVQSNVGPPEPLQIPIKGHVSGPVRIIGGLNYDDSKSLLTLGQLSNKTKHIAKVSLGIKVDKDFDLKVEGVAVRPEGFIKIHIFMDKATRLTNQWIVPVELEVPEGASPLSLTGSNPSNFGKVEFRTNVEFTPSIPMYVTLDITDR